MAGWLVLFDWLTVWLVGWFCLADCLDGLTDWLAVLTVVSLDNPSDGLLWHLLKKLVCV